MKYSFFRLTFWAILSVTVFSCTKEKSIDTSTGAGGSGGGTNAVLGTWKFAGFTAAIKVDATATDGTDVEKAVTSYDYLSTNNKGTVTFAANTFTGTGLGYDLNTILYAKFYTNGVLEDSLEVPFNFTLPPTNSSGGYKLVGADSLYFTGGFIAVGLDSMESKPIGYKYSIAGNKLTMTTNYFNTYREEDNGIITTLRQFADIKVVLEK
jgi:hypothetical protein